jgi:CRISPR/Cas system-associated exonuclease Cas4 (RecB family)
VGSEPRWASASDLSEYAYCPRALYYRRRYPDAPETPPEHAGRAYHHRLLGAERRRAEHGGLYWAGLLLGVAIAAMGVAGGVRP